MDDGSARTVIKMKDHEDDRSVLRLPRCDINKEELTTEQSYAYIDKNDPCDVITWQRVFSGRFLGVMDYLLMFPVDRQELSFAFRIWDNDHDDRCRYFRQLYYADNTAWQLGVKRTIKSLSFTFIAPESLIEVYSVSQTSRYILKVNVVRESGYYLRTVAFPMILISSLSFASNSIVEFGDKVAFNASLLLTTVAYLFITKDVTPQTNEVTILDLITYGALMLSWILTMLQYLSIGPQYFSPSTANRIGSTLCYFVVITQCLLCSFVYCRYVYLFRNSRSLGEI